MSQPRPYRRPSTPVFTALGLLLALGAAQAVHALSTAPREAARIAANREIVRDLGLSDLALFTEARYTRHPALADNASAFQDAPGSFEHFPSGSFVPPAGPWGTAKLGFAPQEVTQ
ncbi:hypothetical protein SAMN05877809_102442 [Rhodobacter sp. JA431]|uniref:hypothetical protein n=1 Tax=Rhodobacter sp. JA431 TaxID=570013 RepID=UPI000BC9B84C|nr:hypothetical protein [Rhodobacter sp. JA431]SOB99441.1 hypothetical protein SAMN05877809_102442 [Rhodobacter sp. JA431]